MLYSRGFTSYSKLLTSALFCSRSVSSLSLSRLTFQTPEVDSLTALPPRRLPTSATPDLEKWISTERTLAFDYMLENIGTSGAVLASPSQSQPNYYYQWVRDSAITMAEVVKEYERSGEERLRKIIDAYANHQIVLQQTVNPSGGFSTGGLGEPKFMMDGSVFDGSWGRPQRDGPALRALTLMRYIRHLNSTDNLDTAWLGKMYDSNFPTNSVIKADLEYTAYYWHQPGFDLWEEVNASHFFTALVQRKALQEGAALADALGDSSAADWYEVQALALGEFLRTSFWDSKRRHLKSMMGPGTEERSGLDAAILLGALHGGDEEAGGFFPVWSDEVLATMHWLVEDMRTRHPVNAKNPPFAEQGNVRATGVGRYPEDVYDGVGIGIGNPWFLCTTTVSDVLYKTLSHFLDVGGFAITPTNRPLFAKLTQSSAPMPAYGFYPSTSPQFVDYITAMFHYADSFINVVRWHALEDGRLSEQFDRNDGYQVGARDLTWSYGSFVAAVESRKEAQRGLEEMDAKLMGKARIIGEL